MTKKNDAAEVAAPVTREYFYPPQDGRPSFMCEAASQEEADALYQAAASEK